MNRAGEHRNCTLGSGGGGGWWIVEGVGVGVGEDGDAGEKCHSAVVDRDLRALEYRRAEQI
jgi:hypothetical protein